MKLKMCHHQRCYCSELLAKRFERNRMLMKIETIGTNKLWLNDFILSVPWETLHITLTRTPTITSEGNSKGTKRGLSVLFNISTVFRIYVSVDCVSVIRIVIIIIGFISKCRAKVENEETVILVSGVTIKLFYGNTNAIIKLPLVLQQSFISFLPSWKLRAKSILFRNVKRNPSNKKIPHQK